MYFKGYTVRIFVILLVVLQMPSFLRAKDRDIETYVSNTILLVDEGEYEEALERFLWLSVHAKGKYRNRRAFGWSMLSMLHPPALTAMKKRRDDKTAIIENLNGTRSLFNDVLALNGMLEGGSKTIDLFRAMDKNQGDLAKQCWPDVKNWVLDAKEYELAKKYLVSPTKDYEIIQTKFRKREDYRKSEKKSSKWLKEHNMNGFVNEVILLIEFAIAINDIKAAQDIQKKALSIVDDKRLRDCITKPVP